MYSHLVAIKVSVESGGNQRMQLNGTTFDQDRFKGLNTQTVKRRSTVYQHGTVFNHLFQNFPNLGAVAFNEAAGAFYVGSIIMFHQPGDHEWPVQFKSHGLRQTALVEFQAWADHNNGTAGVVNTFTQQVAAETAFLAFEHIAQRFQLAASAAGKCFSAL